jgi:hypothetical protein
MTPVSGMNRRSALGLAKELGCRVERVRRTGEVRVSHPELQRPIRINARRKDTGRILTVALRQLAQRSQTLNHLISDEKTLPQLRGATETQSA